jgi:hypothetical protein
MYRYQYSLVALALPKVHRRKKETIALYKGRRIKHAGQYWPVIQLDRFFLLKSLEKFRLQ